MILKIWMRDPISNDDLWPNGRAEKGHIVGETPLNMGVVALPSRRVVARELSEIFRLMAHPDRIRLVEELCAGEMDVNSLARTLDLPAPRVSQHLGLLRARRLVEERRDGRRHCYSLSQPRIAAWIVGGIDFIEARAFEFNRTNVGAARRLWSAPDPEAARG